MALISYARVSTGDQSVVVQFDALHTAGCARIYEETTSGANRDRPQLTAALDCMRKGDTLVVWKFDRLARSLRQLIGTVENLEERGIAFRSLTEAIDTAAPGGRLVFQLFGALAEFERNVIHEHTRAGLDAARARGKKGGRPAKLKEADLKAAKALLADPEIKVSDVARRLGVSPATLYRHIPAPRATYGTRSIEDHGAETPSLATEKRSTA